MNKVFIFLCALCIGWGCTKDDSTDNSGSSNAYSVWDGVSVSVPKDLNDSTRTFSIQSAAELAWLAKTTNQSTYYAGFAGYTITLKTNIDLGGVYSKGKWSSSSKQWTPIGTLQNAKYFYGTFDGCGHKVRGLYTTDSSTEATGLFGYSRGEISNLTIESGLVQNVDTLSNRYVGGICGRSDAAILGCENNAQILAKGKIAYAGGICGYTTHDISACKNSGAVSAFSLNIPYSYDTTYSDVGRAYAGGICAYSSGAISDSKNEGNIRVQHTLWGISGGGIGGIVAKSTSSIIRCTNTADLGDGIMTPPIGGICAYGNAIQYCSNHSTIRINVVGAGVAYSCGLVNQCVNEGQVIAGKGASWVAGVCAYATDITNSINYATINGFSGMYMGGIAGQTHTISGCTNFGSIKMSGSYSSNAPLVGGVMGYAGVAEDCFNKGTITVDSTYDIKVGGIGSGVTLVNCINSAKLKVRTVSGSIGGIAGYGSSIQNCQNTDSIIIIKILNVSASTMLNCGGILNFGNASNCKNSGAIVCYANTGKDQSRNYIGGIIGLGGQAYACTNTGSIYVSFSQPTGLYHIGGIGDCSAYKCLNTGPIKGNLGNARESYVGGISGCAQSVTCSKNTGIITLPASKTGGIAGQNLSGIIQACVSIGNEGIPGILAESANDSIKDCYSTSATLYGSGQAVVIGGGTLGEHCWPTESLWGWGNLNQLGKEWGPTEVRPWVSLGSWNGGAPTYPQLFSETSQ